eukprot:CAMPEP_0198205918 /NCGR_PEP_ID=MMETSP1445-20131203/9454_1 /TAXON_ID=36898 /ORGANISM="Pyramimonas sp., Strain CCMP2087" /LENGTH=664 /DNA_ID=CAMNT_0043878405 /DNA_START=140 /DNA_END=2130 /DNA_ORIENTATION=-
MEATGELDGEQLNSLLTLLRAQSGKEEPEPPPSPKAETLQETAVSLEAKPHTSSFLSMLRGIAATETSNSGRAVSKTQHNSSCLSAVSESLVPQERPEAREGGGDGSPASSLVISSKASAFFELMRSACKGESQTSPAPGSEDAHEEPALQQGAAPFSEADSQLQASAFLSLLQGLGAPIANPAAAGLDEEMKPSEGSIEATTYDTNPPLETEADSKAASPETAADEAALTAELIMQHLQQQQQTGESSDVTAFMSLLESVAEGQQGEQEEEEEESLADDGPVSRRVVVEEGSEPTCSFCGERLEEVYDADEWIYKDSIRVNSEGASKLLDLPMGAFSHEICCPASTLKAVDLLHLAVPSPSTRSSPPDATTLTRFTTPQGFGLVAASGPTVTSSQAPYYPSKEHSRNSSKHSVVSLESMRNHSVINNAHRRLEKRARVEVPSSSSGAGLGSSSGAGIGSGISSGNGARMDDGEAWGNAQGTTNKQGNKGDDEDKKGDQAGGQQLSRLNVGFKMLERMGWSKDTGLGAKGTGIVAPVGGGGQLGKTGLGGDQTHSQSSSAKTSASAINFPTWVGAAPPMADQLHSGNVPPQSGNIPPHSGNNQPNSGNIEGKQKGKRKKTKANPNLTVSNGGANALKVTNCDPQSDQNAGVRLVGVPLTSQEGG